MSVGSDLPVCGAGSMTITELTTTTTQYHSKTTTISPSQQPHKGLAVGGALPQGGGVAPEQWSGTGVRQSSSFAGAPSQRKALIRYCMYTTIVVTKYYYNRARNFCLKKFLPFLPPTVQDNF